jgi:hypothetical protein
LDSSAITGMVGDAPLGGLIGRYKLIRQVGEGAWAWFITRNNWNPFAAMSH